MNEGILYPVDDASIGNRRLVTYSGHGICMPWFGATDLQSGESYMAILETPEMRRSTSLAREVPISISGRCGRPRAASFPIPGKSSTRFSTTALCGAGQALSRVRQGTGLFKTLADKRRQNPNVDLLIGA